MLRCLLCFRLVDSCNLRVSPSANIFEVTNVIPCFVALRARQFTPLVDHRLLIKSGADLS